MIRSTSTTRTVDLALWCREYHRENVYPCDFDRRFAIGLYQIFGGIEWDGINRYESFAAAAVHFLTTLEAMDIAHMIPKDDLLQFETRQPDWERLMLRISRAQQMVFYARIVKGGAGVSKSGRKSRFDKSILSFDLTDAIVCLISSIPLGFRSQAIEDATSNMSGRL